MLKSQENYAKSPKIFRSDQIIALTCRNMVHNIFWCSFALRAIATPPHICVKQRTRHRVLYRTIMDFKPPFH